MLFLAFVNTFYKKVAKNAKNEGYTRLIAYLKKQCKTIAVNADELCERFGSSKYFNVILLGVATGSGELGLSKELVLAEIEKRVPAKFVETNKEAFQVGLQAACL